MGRKADEEIEISDTWIRNELASNTPYDEFVRKILTATGSTKELSLIHI